MLRHLLYPAFGLLVLGGYGFYGATGRDFAAVSAETRTIPPEARVASAGGGFRASPIFWYGGYAGGK
jgi:hypothetical protein